MIPVEKNMTPINILMPPNILSLAVRRIFVSMGSIVFTLSYASFFFLSTQARHDILSDMNGQVFAQTLSKVVFRTHHDFEVGCP